MSLFALLTTVLAIPASTSVEVDFNADYSTNVQGQITSASTVVIKYDLHRATCPHYSTHGADTWSVGAYWAYNGDFSHVQRATIAYTPSPGSPQIYQEPTIVNPPKGDIAIWFVCGSEMGSSYDKLKQQNFAESIGTSSINGRNSDNLVMLSLLLASAIFAKNVLIDITANNVTLDGVITAKSVVNIKYEYEGRVSCPMSPNWRVDAFWVFNDDYNHVHSANIAYVSSETSTGFAIPGIENIPAGDLALWFECSSNENISVDNNQGKNFHFAVKPDPLPVVAVVFNKDFTISTNSTLTTDFSIELQYRVERAACPFAKSGRIDAYWTFNEDYQHVHTANIVRTSGDAVGYRYLPIENLTKGRMDIWFVCTSGELISYDNDRGHNWILDIQ
ncbi:hypothetical protein HDV01_007147 [Terramyces sp. JEL0728]|nr:hypothetical protein HDV01_007147 [Terramyces sp. JEL0728]